LGDAPAFARRPGRHPRAAILASADQTERDVALRLFAIGLHGGELVVCDKCYAGRDFEHQAAERYGARILRPARKTEPGRGPVLSWIRQRIESIFFTRKDRLGLERHEARSLHGLRARIATKLLALAAGVWLNHYLDRPTRGFAALAA
jgi:Transposase DDE domain